MEIFISRLSRQDAEETGWFSPSQLISYQQDMASPRMYPLGFSPNYINAPDWRQYQNISVGLLASHTSDWYRTQVKKGQEHRRLQVKCGKVKYGQVQLVSHKERSSAR